MLMANKADRIMLVIKVNIENCLDYFLANLMYNPNNAHFFYLFFVHDSQNGKTVQKKNGEMIRRS